MQGTLGQLNCIQKDNTKCTLDNVSMRDNDTGDFSADLKLPNNLAGGDLSQFKQNFMSMRYKGQSWMVVNDQSLEDLFDDEMTEEERQ